MQGKDYTLQIKVRNGPMLRAMRLAGYETAAELSRASGASPQDVSVFLSLKEIPITQDGAWRAPVLKIAAACRVLPEDLFPPQHIERALPKNTAEIDLSLEEIERLPGSAVALLTQETPETAAIDGDLQKALTSAFATLTPRERDVIERRFGFNGEPETLEQIGKRHGVIRERIRQIEFKALRKLKHPGVSNRFVEAGFVRERASRECD